MKAAEARFVASQLAVVRRAAEPRVERVTKTTTRPDGTTTVEVTERGACDWHAARWLLECKDRDTFGPDRRELADLRKELAELRRLIAAPRVPPHRRAPNRAEGHGPPAGGRPDPGDPV